MPTLIWLEKKTKLCHKTNFHGLDILVTCSRKRKYLLKIEDRKKKADNATQSHLFINTKTALILFVFNKTVMSKMYHFKARLQLQWVQQQVRPTTLYIKDTGYKDKKSEKIMISSDIIFFIWWCIISLLDTMLPRILRIVSTVLTSTNCNRRYFPLIKSGRLFIKQIPKITWTLKWMSVRLEIYIAVLYGMPSYR